MYADYFGMRGDPFRMTPDPAYIYNGVVYRSTFDRLHAQLSHGQAVLLLAGGPGTGKTTVLKQLETELSAAGSFVLFPRYSTLPLEDFLRICCELSGVSADEIARLGGSEALRQVFADRMGRGEKPVLLVDEAQAMVDEALDDLIGVAMQEEDGQPLARIVFSGHLELAERLAGSEIPAARDAAVDPCRLEALTASEVGEYISHRLQVAGCPDPALFEPEAVRLIADLSSGVPRHINRISGMSLQLAQMAERKRVSADLVQDPAAVGTPSPALDDLLDPGSAPADVAPDPIPSFFSPRADAGPDMADGEPRPEAQGAARPAPADSDLEGVQEAGPDSEEPVAPPEGWPKLLAAAAASRPRGGSLRRYGILGAGFLLGLLMGGVGMLTYLERQDGPVEEAKAPDVLAPTAKDVETPPESKSATVEAVHSEGANDQVAATRVEVEGADAAGSEAPGAAEQEPGPDIAAVPDEESPVTEAAAAPEPATDPVAAAPAGPSLVVEDAEGSEDQGIAIGISLSAPDEDRLEEPVIVVTGLPEGARLSAGVEEEAGTWRLAAGDLPDLVLRPPAQSSGQFDISVTASARAAGGETVTAAESLAVTVVPVADVPTLSAEPAAGREDEPLPLSIAAGLVDADGSESLLLRVGNLPPDARLSAGVEEVGFWSLGADDLDGLALRPPVDFAGRFELSVEAIAREADGQRALATAALPVEVAPVADPPAIMVEAAAGLEDQAIPLSVDAALVDKDGSETLAVTISGLPDGARLSAGEEAGDGLWRLAPEDLAGLTLMPSPGYSGSLELTVEAIAQEGDGKRAAAAEALVVEVAPVADAPVLAVKDAGGLEDEAIALSVGASLADRDGSESLSVTISGLPADARLSAGEAVEGLWRLGPDGLAGLTLRPPDGYSGRLELEVEAVAVESDGKRASTVDVVTVEVAPVVDAPVLAVEDASGPEDETIPLSIGAALGDRDGSETLSVVLSGLPEDVRLSAGAESGEGAWRLDPDDLAGLALQPAADFSGNLELSVQASAEEVNGERAAATGVVAVEVRPVADVPVLTVESASGLEDEAVPLSIGAALADRDGSETLSVLISGLPAGAGLSAGEVTAEGPWRLGPDDLAGLALRLAEGYSGRLELGVEAVAQETDGTRATASEVLAVEVASVTNAPMLSLEDARGLEDEAIPLSIGAALAGGDESETLSVLVSGLPEGAGLSAGRETDAGQWRLGPEDLAGLALRPAEGYSGRLELAVEAVAEETDGTSATSAGVLAVEVVPVADAPVLSLADAGGVEDEPIPLSIAAAADDPDGSEALSVVISGLPPGARLSAGEETAAGVWRLDPGELAGLALEPAENHSGRLELGVEASAREAESEPVTATGVLAVEVAPVADAPVLAVVEALGLEDEAIPLSISAALSDLDGSETLSVEISGLPEGARLSAGQSKDDGTWSLAGEDLTDLELLTPADFSGRFDLAVKAEAREASGDSRVATATLEVLSAPVADVPVLTVEAASGQEDAAVPLSIGALLADGDGSETLSVLISGVPEGAALTAGEEVDGGLWSLGADDLAGLALLPPAHYAGPIELDVEAVAREAEDGARAATGEVLVVGIEPLADPPALTAENATGLEDTAIPVSVTARLADADGSEALSLLVSGLPAGARLSTGEAMDDGVWRLAPEELAELAVTPPAGFSGRLELAIEAVAREKAGPPARSAGAVLVEVAPVADSPSLTVEDTAGSEDEPIPLSIVAASGDPDGSELLTVAVSGLPEEARLTAGERGGEGTWLLGMDDLAGLALLPPVDFSGGLELAAEAFAEETAGAEESAGEIASTRSTFKVEVAPVADPPLLTIDGAAGVAGETVPLSIAVARVDLDGSESLSTLIAGLPEDAWLTAGDLLEGGVWRVSPSDLADLALVTPDDLTGAFALTVQAVAEEPNGARAVTTADLAVDISSPPQPATLVADAAEAAGSKLADDLIAPAAAGTEDLSGVATAQAEPDAPLPGAEWMTRGDDLRRLGDVAAARLYYELAADEGHPRAATAVAKTFDPLYLAEIGILGTTGNPDKAMKWYQRGIDGGDAEASRRLGTLRQWLAQ